MAIEKQDSVTLVLGGTGKTGRRVAERLRRAGHAVRIGSRAGTPPFDWDRRESWDAALAGATSAYVAFQPDLAVPGALETVDAFFRRAAASGVERLVLLSGRGEPEAENAERALQAAGVPWTILRASWFCQNFSESVFLEPIRAGLLALPVGAVAEPFVDADDIADIAVAALTAPGHAGRLYEITGPRALTFADAAAEIARATGRDIAFVQVSPEDYRAALVREGVPQIFVDLVLHLLTTVLDGRNAPTAQGVQQALGRPPRDFTDFARAAAATGIWGGRHD
ncbi:NmrA family transcriptional regulator [Labrys wisconsinensis]|uniref:Uncharacterized protein YbjT (DUF2867 family) n=1 Tax=Labrys wisconsinensis TaxID=425677 RepID=A0ABU0JFT8_9HYPH|nr:NmrA family transcriptional regulator [Labrys wisconsinensis]MDQ0473157.1 uncharacterized protein YbjT (DUF2867 family) [Labrys wisconsinensis]